MTAEGPRTDGSLERARLSVACGAIARPVAGRFVAGLAAETGLSLDRVDEAILLAETLADRCSEISADGRVELSVALHEDGLEIRVGPFPHGRGSEVLRRDAAQPEGGAIRGLATAADVRRGRTSETLRILVGARAREG